MPSIQAHHLAAFRRHLQARERRPAMVEKYCREVRAFARGMKPGQVVTKELVLAWKANQARRPNAEHLLDDMITWPDNLETAWYYEQVQEATNSHTYTMHTDAEKNPYEIWSELLPVRDWAQLEKEWSDAHSGQTGGEVV